MEICDKARCTGCGACSWVCPKNAITMIRNKKGFLEPFVDESLCVECGKCQRNCHINNDVTFNKVKEKYLFRNSNFDIRKKSSSGGTFFPIAEQMIQKEGLVFGAEFADDLMVQHNFYKNLVDALRFSTSKYLQSDLRDSYKVVEDALLKNEKVLFSGTPCQVAGLKSYLNARRCPTEELVTVDFICHGVGSPKFWKDCLEHYHTKYKSKVVSANFRGKPRPGKLQNLLLIFENGKKKIAPSANMEVYFYHFLKNYILRDSCFSCKYSRGERVSDISLGDCFRAGKVLGYLDDGYGLSQVMINTDKGREFIDGLKKHGDCIKVNVDEYQQINLKRPTSKPQKYDSFWNVYVKDGFRASFKVSEYDAMKNKIKHLILCVAYYLRFDSILKKIALFLKK